MILQGGYDSINFKVNLKLSILKKKIIDQKID
jgi:hypothetical protein